MLETPTRFLSRTRWPSAVVFLVRYTSSVSGQILKSTVWQLLSQATMAALSVVTVKCVAVGLSVELAGYYNSAYGFLQLFGILADFGLYAVSIREVSRAENKARVLGALLVLRIVILLCSIGVAVVIAWLLPAWHGTPLPLAVTIAAFVPSLTLIAGVLRAVFQVHHKMQFVFVAEVSQRVLTVILLGGALVMGIRGSMDTNVLFWFLAFGSLGSLLLLTLSIIFSRKLEHVTPVFDKALLKRLLLLALPYGAAFLFTALYRQTDVTLIALLRPDFAFQNAAYGFVQRVMDMVYLFPTFLLNSTLPSLRPDDRAGAGRLLPRTLIGTLMLCGGCAMVSALWARPVMQLLTTSAYLSHDGLPGSDSALQLLSISMTCNGVIVFAFYVLLAVHAWKPLVSILAGGALLSVVSNITLIPALGFMGAAETSACVHSLMAVSLFIAAWRVFPFTIPWKGLLRWLLWMSGLALFLWLLKPILDSSLWTFFGLVLAAFTMFALSWASGLWKVLLPREG